MAKTFTKQEPVSVSYFGADQTEYASGDEADSEMNAQLVDRIKNLRFRPSLSSMQNIMKYAQQSMRSTSN
jgi:hypothetical protein